MQQNLIPFLIPIRSFLLAWNILSLRFFFRGGIGGSLDVRVSCVDFHCVK